ncbi:protein CcmA, bactofilin family [Cupriavidus sp. OV038]|jgi:cytoskeletal protein CcmA (bactofilin family)|uniref:bactofilin family protein n=1 Tax=unclassified Cupriavidus TaxID=2640874 RepID=UPI0008E1739C|nr:MULTISPECIES: polymer-forming cytoskeletal protein [unclassified Cupriavidus]SFC84234.1 protein CcmA, bactofilin family [Cupriavidus sp. OV038]SFO80040.1 protein CcmA, bactofilin family [Cupriavidus sp. OV096]
MLFSKKKGLSIDTLIGQDATIEGDVTFAGGLRLDGRVRGNVLASDAQRSMLVISEKGAVEGEVRVGHLILNGTVTGPVSASELLELQPHARVYGEVHYAALEMHQGAIVEGRLVPIGQGEVRALPNHVPAAEVNQETPVESNTSETEAEEVSAKATPENAGAAA